MKVLRFLFVVFAAGLIVPILAGAIHLTGIGFSNGHWSAPIAALVHSTNLLPLALLAAPLNTAGASIVAAFSLGLERLIRRRSLIAWLGHGSAVGVLQLLWVTSSPPAIVEVLILVVPWLLVSLGMWAGLSRGRDFDDEFALA